MRAGSALLRVGSRLLAIQDDAFAAAVWIDPATCATTPLLTEADGTPSRRKVEGLAFDDAGDGWRLTDPDDPARPAELCRVKVAFRTATGAAGSVP